MGIDTFHPELDQSIAPSGLVATTLMGIDRKRKNTLHNHRSPKKQIATALLCPGKKRKGS